jgi:haloalkane dehalogenase
MTSKNISSEFPFTSRFIEVSGSKIHYIEEGTGDPIVFIHGNPTSSYLWRNIIPYLTPYGRCIAIDLIGMGKSDKPGINYRFADHAKYVDGFIEKMELTNLKTVDIGPGIHYLQEDNPHLIGSELAQWYKSL